MSFLKKYSSNNLKKIRKNKRFSPLSNNNAVLKKNIKKYVHGKVIDLGCGSQTYRHSLNKNIKYYSLDIEKRTSDVDFVSNIMNMHIVKSETFNSAMCFSVLEHVKNPAKAAKEIHRILKNDGVVIITVPHISRIHEAPHDYFRFTNFGIEALLRDANFEIISTHATGGLFSFLAHQWSIIFLLFWWPIPFIRTLALNINYFLCIKPAIFLDNLLDKNKLFATGFICVAKKTKNAHLYN